MLVSMGRDEEVLVSFFQGRCRTGTEAELKFPSFKKDLPYST